MSNIALISLIIMTYSTQIFGMDANLEKCIRSKVSESGTSASRITELSCSSRNIVSIAGIEDLESIMALDLSDNKITDFSPIKKLKTKNLRVIYVTGNKIKCDDFDKAFEALNGLMVLGLDRAKCVSKETPIPPSKPTPPGSSQPPAPPSPPQRPPMPPQRPPRPPMPPKPPSGKPKPGRQGEGSNKGLTGVEVYKKECAVCHGEEGEGTERGYPLRFVKWRFAELVTRRGREYPPEFEIDMPAYDEEIVSNQQMNEMLNYLYSFPKPETGKELYFYYCQNCHGASRLRWREW